MSKETPKFMLKYLLFFYVFILLVIMLSSFSKALISKNEINQSANDSTSPIIIIDAGHGGEDGGAIGNNGIYEKDLNLTISENLADMLGAAGYDVVMTRTEDKLLYDKTQDFKGRKKILDLAGRLEIANKYSDAIFISIHMNSFPQEKYSGLQVYYSKNNDNSKIIAEIIQSSVKAHLQPNNNRACKEASSNIFLLDRAQSAAVLIECGFLSNNEECALLSTEEYQRKLSLSIFNGICEYIIGIST